MRMTKMMLRRLRVKPHLNQMRNWEPVLEQIYEFNSAAEPDMLIELNQNHELFEHNTDSSSSDMKSTPSPQAHHALTIPRPTELGR